MYERIITSANTLLYAGKVLRDFLYHATPYLLLTFVLRYASAPYETVILLIYIVICVVSHVGYKRKHWLYSVFARSLYARVTNAGS